MAKYVMALDQGTTSSRCILFNKQGQICSMAQKEFEQIYPQPGWVEHNPMEIWASQMSVAAEAMTKIQAQSDDIAAIGITNQRETTIVWNKETGMPVYNAIVWQCRRTSVLVDELKEKGYSDKIREKTGTAPTVINPYYITGQDTALLEQLKADHKVVITLEDGILDGGFGEKIARFYGDSAVKTKCFGLKKEFLDRYNVQEVLKENHLTAEQIADDVAEML